MDDQIMTVAVPWAGITTSTPPSGSDRNQFDRRAGLCRRAEVSQLRITGCPAENIKQPQYNWKQRQFNYLFVFRKFLSSN